MRYNRDLIWFPALEWRNWAAELGEWLRQKMAAIRVRAVSLVRRLQATTPDQWFLVGFVLLLMAFLFVLLVQPSSVGRGGR
jgi:hypothetical protein